MTIKQKFERIDQSKLEPNQVNALKIVVDFTENFKTTDKEKIKITNDKLDTIIGKLQEKNPDALKPAPTAKKAGTAKKTSSTKTPKRNVFSVAKEIKKAGETFEEAKVRASKVIKQEKEEANKIVKTEMQKLQEYIKEHKELQGISGTDLGRDASRVAKVGGRRISKNGNIYYENRENRKDRLAPNYPKYAPLLANGGEFMTDPTFGNFQNQVYAQGGGIRSQSELKKIFSEKQNLVKNLTPKQIAEMWNKNSYGVKEGVSKPMTIEEAKNPTTRMYLENLLIENELTEDEQSKYFSNGGAFAPNVSDGTQFMGSVYAKGGLLTPRERYILEIKGLSGVRATAIEDYIEDNGLSNDDVLNIVIGLGRRQLKGTDVSTAIVGKKGNSESKKLIAFAKGNEALKMELGGVMATDLAGHTGGSFGTNTPTLLSGYSGTYYTGLVGETNAMSSGEMFEAGGTLSDPAILNAYSGTRYTGLVAETGALSSGELFEMGGGLPEGNLDSKDFIKNKKYFNSVEGGIYTFSNKDESGRLHFKDSKNNDRIFSSKKMYEVKSKLEMGGGLPNGVQQSYVNYYLGSTGVLAEGGSLEAHGIEEGDTFIKTIAGNIQKVKDKDGKIVFINLSTGERDSQPPLPFKKGGSVDHKYLNHNQDYEVRYAKGKNRHGYGNLKFAEGGETEFSEKRKKYLEKLGNKEAEVWDKIGATSGGQIRKDKTLLKEYAEGVEKMLINQLVGLGSFDQQDYDFYTDENWHLFNDFLVWNNYYEPEMTKVEKAWRKKAFEKDPKHNYISNPEVISLNAPIAKMIPNLKKHYVSHDNIESVTVKKGGKEVTYDAKDVLNGANMLEKGGQVEKIANYISKNNIIHVELKDGTQVKPSNGYWIKKGATPINKMDEGGNLDKVKWQDVEKGDSARVKDDNKMGLVVKNYGRKFHLKFPNGTEKTFDASDLEFFKLEKDEYEMDDDYNYKKGGKVEEAIINKDGIRVRSVSQPKKKLTESEWMAKHSESKEARSYKAGGDLSKYSEFIQDEFPESKKLANKFAKKYNLPFLVLVEKDNDDSIYVKEANGFYAFPKSYIDAHYVLYVTADKMAEGGITFDEKSSGTAVRFDLYGYKKASNRVQDLDIIIKANSYEEAEKIAKKYLSDDNLELVELYTKEGFVGSIRPNGKFIYSSRYKKEKFAQGGATFDEKSSSIAKKFVGKAVEPKYQKQYGKVYSKEEANEVGDKIAGSMVAKEKMAKGGVTSRGGIMLLAKQIRKENESWKDALKRAGEQLRK